MYDKNNVFAKIIRGEIPCDKIYENEFAICFNDIAPDAKTHVLVLPKGEYTDFYDFTTNASKEFQVNFWASIADIQKLLKIEKQSQVIMNIGAPQQSVFHFHVHLMAPMWRLQEKRLAEEGIIV